MHVGSMNVSDFFRSIPQRVDGKILMFAVVICEIFFFINYIDPLNNLSGANRLESDPDKWTLMWGVLPIILVALYIKKRVFSNDDANSIGEVLIEISWNFGIVIYIFLRNWNLL